MNMLVANMKVKTPIGDGMVQGAFAVNVGSEPVVKGVLVRLPINELTRTQMTQSNCLTPRAAVSGVWVFQESELL